MKRWGCGGRSTISLRPCGTSHTFPLDPLADTGTPSQGHSLKHDEDEDEDEDEYDEYDEHDEYDEDSNVSSM